MKKIDCFHVFFFLAFVSIHAQTLIKGTVVTSKSMPIRGASVYLNNSTIGTTTDKNGKFELLIREGKFELVASFIGYKTIIYNIDASTYEKPLFFKLRQATNFLDEVVLKKTTYDAEWRYNLRRFKVAFLGSTKLASQSKIINPKVLSFEYDKTTGTLSAFAKEPLQIENRGLGYLITYDLVRFSLERRKVTYLGLTKYQNIEGKKAKQNRYVKKRLKAYNGSLMHFIRSLRAKNLKAEGFIVHQFKRVLNQDMPSEENIKKARAYLKPYSSTTQPANFSKKITAPQTVLDSALWTIQRAKLPKYRDFLYKKNVPYENMIVSDRKLVLLKFENYLSIIYTKESEEASYRARNNKDKEAGRNQTSAITMTRKTAILDPSGMVIDPLSIFAEGYWSHEQFADLLPLDYQPMKN